MKTLLAAAFALTLAAAPVNAADYLEATSPHDVGKTLDQLKAAIEASPANLFTVVDHQANAKKAGLEMPATVVVMFGNPKVGTPIMQAAPEAALDLPTKILIWDDKGQTRMRALGPDGLTARYGIEGDIKQITMMGGALQKLMGAAAK